MSRPWMPLYARDYLADILDLNTLQRGAYMNLILHYWLHRGLTGDEAKLREICKFSRYEWKKFSPAIREKFYMAFPDAWYHKRIEAELQHADDISKSAKERSAKGVAARGLSKQPNGEPEVNLARAPSPSPTPSKKIKPSAIADVKKKTRTSINAQAELEEASREFAVRSGMNCLTIEDEWAQFRDHHLKHASLMADWGAAWRTWVRNSKKFQSNGHHGRSNGNEGFVKSVLRDIEDDKRGREESPGEIIPMLQLVRQ